MDFLQVKRGGMSTYFMPRQQRPCTDNEASAKPVALRGACQKRFHCGQNTSSERPGIGRSRENDDSALSGIVMS